jgi:hypothetical protein
MFDLPRTLITVASRVDVATGETSWCASHIHPLEVQLVDWAWSDLGIGKRPWQRRGQGDRETDQRLLAFYPPPPPNLAQVLHQYGIIF